MGELAIAGLDGGRGGVAGIVWWLASTLVLWWDTGSIAAVRVQKAQLAAEVAEMQANWDEWAKAGLAAKLERCGPKPRSCVRVDEKAGAFGTASDYRVLLGY